MFRPSTLLPLLIALCASACSEPGAPVERPERVVVVVLDTTRAGELGCYGDPHGLTPAVDALAARGRRFDAALSNSTWTLPSTVSLLTGLLQERHRVVTNKHVAHDGLTLLPERLGAAGYLTASFSEMIYASGVHGLDRGFEEARYYSLTGGTHPLAMGREVAAWMDAHAQESYFLYVHFRRPHSPYEPNALVHLRTAPDCALGDGRHDERLGRADTIGHGTLPEDEAAHARHLYRANLANADRALAPLLERLADDPGALVVLTSDHGESLGEHDYWGHGYRLHDPCVSIPLIVAGPGVEPGVDAGPASTVDVTPTLLELCGVERPAGLDGRSLAARLAGAAPDERPVLLSTRYTPGNVPRQGVVSGAFKLVLDAEGGARLHDRRSDPHERHDVAAEHPDVVARLRELAEARRSAGAGLAREGTVDLDVHAAELKALGYLR